MEAKRRKLSPSASPGSSSSGKPRSSTSSPDAQKKSVTREQLKSDDPKTQAAALKTLKKQISTKTAVMAFVDAQEPNGRFFAVVDVLTKLVAEVDTEGCDSPSPLLKDVIGILANCCYYSTTACLEMKSTHIRFNYLAVKLYNSPKLSEDCTFSLTRLVANMCAHKETALSISSCSSLVEMISKLLDSDHTATSVQALRCVRLLVQSSFTRAVLQANAGFYLGKVLSKRRGKQLQDAVALLQMMCQRYVRDVGRQLANRECVDALLSFYFAKDEKAQSLVIRLSGGSSDIRDSLGEATVIQRIVEESDDERPNSGSCALLATFSHDAWGRAALRTSGALDILVKRLSVSDSESERMSLVLSFKHFVHDTAGMAHLAASRLFVDTVAQDVLKYLENNGTACKPQLQNEEVFRPDSPLLMEIETNLRQKTTDEEREQRLHKDFFSLWAYSSPSPAFSHTSSYSYSPPSSGAGSPVQSSSPTSPMSAGTSFESNHGKRRAASASDDWEDDSGSGMSERCRISQTIIDSELWLIAWQAQEDSNLPHLIRPDLVNALIGYLSLAPRPDFRVGRALKRMASFRISIDRLLRIQFHTRIFTSLCGAPCRLARNAKRCARCERCADFGREVLREFSSNVDSDFGYAYLKQEFAKEDFVDTTKAAIAKVALIKNRGRVIRSLNITHPMAVNMLFDSLKTLLEKDDFEAVVKESTYPDGPPLAAQIIGAMSTLVPQNKIREIFDIEATFIPSERVLCRISGEDSSSGEEDSTEMLSFEENGVILASIPLEAACKSSGYFEGMFASTWKETKSGQRTFPFDAATEHCSSADFTRFLHYLAGCRDECTRVDNSVSLLALIQLSDRYLCPTLGSWLCSPHGPLSRLLTGDSLHFLLPAALTANMHPRFLSSCLATLMRYANGEDVVSALVAINSTPMLIEMFLSNLRLFVTGAASS